MPIQPLGLEVFKVKLAKSEGSYIVGRSLYLDSECSFYHVQNLGRDYLFESVSLSSQRHMIHPGNMELLRSSNSPCLCAFGQTTPSSRLDFEEGTGAKEGRWSLETEKDV